MKKIFLLPLILFCLFFTQVISFAKDGQNTYTNPILFNNENYYLKFARTYPLETINEYVRKNETVQKWDKLLAVRYYNHSVKLKKYIKDTYVIEKDDYVLISIENDDNIAYVSFLMIASDYIEYNYWKYIVTDENVIAIQYAKKFNFSKKTTIENLMKKIQLHRSEIEPIIQKDLNFDIKFIDLGEE